MSQSPRKEKLVIKGIAVSDNPLIDMRLFRAWERRMALLKQLGVDFEAPRESAEQAAMQPIPLSALHFPARGQGAKSERK